VIGLIFSRTITRPMYELIDRAVRIGQGDREAFRPLTHYGTREFALLSRNFLDMAGQLARRSDYIASFSAHLTHELKSPLTSIKGAAELLLDSVKTGSEGLTRPEQESFLSNILSDAARLEAIAQRLRELARAETIDQRESAELASVIENLRDRFPALTFETSGSLDRAVGMSAEKTLIVLSHLADNALRHHARTMRLAIVCAADRVHIEVSNDGDPISEQNRGRIFDAFFTTRRESGGTGMGLAIVRSVMTSRGGAIALRPAADDVTFELRFPPI
jgi:two-component system, OmpR family, sensor histidine kinase CreC